MMNLFYSVTRTRLLNGWRLRFRKRLRLKSGQFGKAHYNASVNLTPGGASLSGSLGPLTLNIGLRRVTITWRLGHGVTITRQISFRRLVRSPSADTDTFPDRQRKRRTNSRKRRGKA